MGHPDLSAVDMTGPLLTMVAASQIAPGAGLPGLPGLPGPPDADWRQPEGASSANPEAKSTSVSTHVHVLVEHRLQAPVDAVAQIRLAT